MNFPMPAGFEPPDTMEPGAPFEAVATLTLSDDGTLTLTAIDGAPLEDEPTPEEAPSTDGDFMGAVAGEFDM